MWTRTRTLEARSAYASLPAQPGVQRDQRGGAELGARVGEQRLDLGRGEVPHRVLVLGEEVEPARGVADGRRVVGVETINGRLRLLRMLYADLLIASWLFRTEPS